MHTYIHTHPHTHLHTRITHMHTHVHPRAHTHAYTCTHILMGRSTLFSLRFPLLPTKSVPSKFHLHVLIHTPLNPDVWLLPHYPPQYSQQGPKGPQLPVPVPLPQPAGLPDPPSPQVTAPPSCITSCCCLSSPPFLSHLTYIMFQFPSTSAPSGAHQAQRRVRAPGLSPALSSFTQLQPPAPPCCSARHTLPSPRRPGSFCSRFSSRHLSESLPDCCVQEPLLTRSHTLTD